MNAIPSPCAPSASDEWNDDINMMTPQTHSNRGKFMNQSTPTYWKIGQGSAYSLSRSPVPPSCEDAIHSPQYKLSWLKQSITKTPVHTLSTCMILAMPWAALIVFGSIFMHVRSPYMISMGFTSFLPRFLPSIVPLLFAPLLGAASDHSTSKWGRRNMFLLIACSLITLSGLLFASASIFFPKHHNVIAFLFLCLITGCVLMQISLRARIMDALPLSFQVHAQVTLACWDGLGGVFGMLLFRNTAVLALANEVAGWGVFVALGCSIMLMIFATMTSLYFRPEQPTRTRTSGPRFRVVQSVRGVLYQIQHCPKLLRILCVVHFVLYLAWSAFQTQTYDWWGTTVYKGCNNASSCQFEEIEQYKDGLRKANLALITQSSFQVAVCLSLLFVMPRVPDIRKLTRSSVIFAIIGAGSLIIAAAVGSFSKSITFIAFVIAACFHIMELVFPFSVIGIMGKEIEKSEYAFTNNGLYIGVITVFSALSDISVQVYGIDSMASLGTGNKMVLPCVLFCSSALCLTILKYT